jgi:HD-GYP domain-containing protein (c-di-GMP phosphodiesterase class II)
MALSLIKMKAMDLETGMYVSELDRPWVETPFPLQGFHIKSRSDAEKVQNFCKFVFIDVEKGAAPDENTTQARQPTQNKKKPTQATNKTKSTSTSKIPPKRSVKLKSVKYTNHQPLESELSKGEVIYTEIETAFEDSLKALAKDEKFDAEASKKAVKQITESVIRNPDALVWLSKMKASHDASYSHAIRASVLAASFGVHLGMKQEDIELLTLAVLLCDIGIAKLPKDALLLAKRIELEDIPEYKMHIMLSIEILEKADNIPEEIIPIIEAHHERLDGSGYPFSLAGNQIPILAQIAGLVDEFDKITSIRSQGSQLTPSDGASRIYKMRNGAFNEQLVEEFIKAIGIYPAGTLVELNSEEVGIVIAQNPERKLLPKVMILRDKDGKVVHKKTIVDLYQRSQAQSSGATSIRKSLIDAGIELDLEDITQGFTVTKPTTEKSWSLKNLFSSKG